MLLLIQLIGLSKIKVSSISFRHDIAVLDVSCIVLNLISGISLHKISSFPLRISPVYLTKSKVSCETGKLRFLCSKDVFTIVSVKNYFIVQLLSEFGLGSCYHIVFQISFEICELSWLQKMLQASVCGKQENQCWELNPGLPQQLSYH